MAKIFRKVVFTFIVVGLSVNILSAEENLSFNEGDTKLCRTLAVTFDGIDEELLRNCIYEAQSIRNNHQCAKDQSTVACLLSSCNVEPPVDTYSKVQIACLTKHVSAEDAELFKAVADMVQKIINEQ